MKWHPYAETFPWIEGEEWEGFKKSIMESGGNKDNPVRYRIVNGDKEGLDGRNREKACRELKLPCTYQKVVVEDDAVLDWIDKQNIHRRNNTAESRAPQIEYRRRLGETQADIAKAMNCSQTTVARTLKAKPVTGVVVKGSNGKSYKSESRQRKSGREVPGDHPFRQGLRTIRAHVDYIADFYEVNNTPGFENVLRRLSDLHTEFENWLKSLKARKS